MTFSVQDRAVCLGRIRFTPDQVDQLMELFSRERAWDLFDSLLGARDALMGGYEAVAP